MPKATALFMSRALPIAGLTLGLLVSGTADAKDLRQRVGVGAANQFPHIASVSVKYGLPAKEPAVNIQVQVVAGLSVLEGADDAFFVGARGLYGLVAEDNMNLYVGGGAAFMTQGDSMGLRLQPAGGAEFFLHGLENLGFSAELGLNMDLMQDATNLFTVSGGPAVGVHYYF